MRIEKHVLAFAAVGGILAAGACSLQSESVPPIDTPASGIQGRVVAWPVCPVETGEPQCAARPIAARVVISGGANVTVETGGDGPFLVAVPPGLYLLRATTEGMLCTPLDVTVPSNGYAQAEIRCDTGIR